MSRENKEISRRYLEEVWNGGNLDAVEEYVSPDYIGHDPVSGEVRGPAAVKEFIRSYRTAFPDLRVTIDQQIAEGDLLAERWTAIGTHKGELMGIPPTGKQATVTGISISHISGGKIVEGYTNWDALGLLRQLGVVEVPTPAPA